MGKIRQSPDKNTQIVVNRDNCEPAIFDVKNTTPKSKRENVRTAMKSNLMIKSNNMLKLDQLNTEYLAPPNLVPTPSGNSKEGHQSQDDSNKSHKKSIITAFGAQNTQMSRQTATTPTVRHES